MYVCMYECMYVCMHACMHACIYIIHHNTYILMGPINSTKKKRPKHQPLHLR